jgi:hypothetical protein
LASLDQVKMVKALDNVIFKPPIHVTYGVLKRHLRYRLSNPFIVTNLLRLFEENRSANLARSEIECPLLADAVEKLIRAR